MYYVANFVPSYTSDTENTIDPNNSLVVFRDTESCTYSEIRTLFDVMLNSESFRQQTILGLVFHTRDDNDVILSPFYRETDDDIVPDIKSHFEACFDLEFDYDKPIEEVKEEVKDENTHIYFSKRLGYVSAEVMDNEVVGYLVNIGGTKLYSFSNKDYHVYLKDDFMVDTDLESRWFRRLTEV